MVFKRKHLTVEIFSAAIIVLVMVSTLIGYSVYVQWKEDTAAVDYSNSMYKLTAEIFRKYVEIHNIRTIIREDDHQLRTAVLEGKVKNNSSKTITSIMIELSFSRPDGCVVYRDWFYPLGEGSFPGSPFFSAVKRARKVLEPGESLSFKYLLRNCPPEVISRIFADSEFAKTGPEQEVELDLSVAGISIL